MKVTMPERAAETIAMGRWMLEQLDEDERLLATVTRPAEWDRDRLAREIAAKREQVQYALEWARRIVPGDADYDGTMSRKRKIDMQFKVARTFLQLMIAPYLHRSGFQLPWTGKVALSGMLTHPRLRRPWSQTTKGFGYVEMTPEPPPETELVSVTELVAGDLIDLEGDPLIDPRHGEQGHVCHFAFELIVVGDDYERAGAPAGPGLYHLYVQGGPGAYLLADTHQIRRAIRTAVPGEQHRAGPDTPPWN